MRKTEMRVLSLVIGVMLFGSASAFAGGYPFGVISTRGSTNAIVVGNFASGSGQFTQAEAENLTVSVTTLVQGVLDSSSGSTPAVYTPNQLATYDGDALITLVKTNYRAWGYDIYAVVNITKTREYAAGFGPNVRLDVYIADMAAQVDVRADYLYVTSIEVPYMYASFLNRF